jgi:hypothetical protein
MKPKTHTQKTQTIAQSSFPALFGFAYNPVSNAAFGSLPTLDFRVESLGEEFFM